MVIGFQCLKNKDLRHVFFDTPGAAHYHTAPMSTPPDRPLDAQGLARSGAVVERDFPIAGFARLRDRLAEPKGLAAVRAEFRLLGGFPVTVLRVEAGVVLICQRCLGPVRRELESVAHLAFAPDETLELPPEYEAIGGDAQELDLAALVEDELILSLPLIARHTPAEECNAAGVATKTQPRAPEMRRPFAGLKDLLKP
ncbi:MAG: YceD family protein [Steroidobacteraceae bacterium]